MNYSVLIFLIFTVSLVVYASPKDGKIDNLQHLCDDLKILIDSGKFLATKKVLDDCVNKTLPGETSEHVKKCQAIIPMKTPDEVKTVCSNVTANEPKFKEARDCMRSKKSDEHNSQEFMGCMMKAMSTV